MIRLLGFVVGSAASIGAIFLLIGIPELNLSNPHLDKDRFEEALQQLRDKQRELELAATNKPVKDPVPSNDAGTGSSVQAPGKAVASDVAAPDELAVDIPDTLENAPPSESERQWYTFWNPFRSEIAARGFVSQLERVTGLDYRVTKVKTGVYEVAFAYVSDTERQNRLSQIQAATGLDLPGS